ncbi:MAG: hypothetical protein Crog4KO_14310 [Crocinitomicaceae bacterium]
MKRKLLSLLSVIVFTSSVHSAVIYVNSQATGMNNGTSWNDAYTDLNAAIGSASSGDELWVAAGSYSPPSGNQFIVSTEILMYGGFPATGNPTMVDRDWETNTTVLNGDLNGDDDQFNFSDNAPRVISFGNDFTIDGFEISRGGNGTVGYFGAGLHTVAANASISNCKFIENRVYDVSTGFLDGAGGGIWLEGSNAAEIQDTVIISNCWFEGNVSLNGGGICAERGVVIKRCRFGKNVASVGPAISIIAPWDDLRDEVFADVNNSVFWGNNVSNSQPAIHLTTTRNSADGSSIYFDADFCTFYQEQSTIGYVSNNPSTNFSNIYIALENSLIDLVSDQNGIFPFDFSQATDGAFLTSFGPNLSNSTNMTTGHFLEVPQYQIEDTTTMQFLLDCSSGGIDFADSITEYALDADGNARVNGSRPDIGAFESPCQSNVGVYEVAALNNGMTVFPNPASTEVRIRGYDSNVTSVKIIDVSGKVMVVHPEVDGRIDVTKLSQGIYSIQVVKAGELLTARFIKK